jgi:DNA-binding MarR family transcriptional regulator
MDLGVMSDLIRTFGYLALGTRLKRLGERLQAGTQKMIDQSGMSVAASQFPYLAAVKKLGPVAIGDLAEALGVTQPAVTRTVMQLVEAGLLTAEPAPDDQRRRIVRVSARGTELLDRARISPWPEIEAAVRDLCGHLEGPLLDQLTAIEDALDEKSLEKRSLRFLQEREPR